MIKDFNAFITEDKEYNEIFTLVEEVLSNDYSNREIEESFDEFNLLLESISMDDINLVLKECFGKGIVNAAFLGPNINEKKLNEVIFDDDRAFFKGIRV